MHIWYFCNLVAHLKKGPMNCLIFDFYFFPLKPLFFTFFLWALESQTPLRETEQKVQTNQPAEVSWEAKGSGYPISVNGPANTSWGLSVSSCSQEKKIPPFSAHRLPPCSTPREPSEQALTVLCSVELSRAEHLCTDCPLHWQLCRPQYGVSNILWEHPATLSASASLLVFQFAVGLSCFSSFEANTSFTSQILGIATP